jgi:predicted thioesterase
MANSWVLLTAKMDRVEGRKLYMSAKMQDESGNVLADSTTLFITPKSKLANNEVSQPTL